MTFCKGYGQKSDHWLSMVEVKRGDSLQRYTKKLRVMDIFIFLFVVVVTGLYMFVKTQLHT